MINCPRIELGQLVTPINGLWTGKKPPFKTVAVIRNTNFSKDCRLKMDDVAMIEVEERQFASRKLQVGDIIIEKSGGSDKQPVGRPVLFNISEGDYSFSNFTGTLRINDTSKVLPAYLQKYLYHFYLMGKTAEMQSKTTGLRNLDFKAYLRIPIPVPLIKEQQHIIEVFNLLGGIIDSKNAQLRDLDSLAKSMFHEMFGNPVVNEKGWPKKKLGDVCIIERGGSPRPIQEYLTDAPDGINWIKIGDAVAGSKFIRSTAEKIKPEGVRKSRFVHAGDFILSNSMSFGKPYILDIDGCIHDGWLVLRDNQGIFNTSYLYYYLSSNDLYNEFKRLAVGGVVNNLNSNLVRGISVSIPPREKQDEFARKENEIEKQRSLLSRSINEVEMLLNSKMDYYFSEV